MFSRSVMTLMLLAVTPAISAAQDAGTNAEATFCFDQCQEIVSSEGETVGNGCMGGNEGFDCVATRTSCSINRNCPLEALLTTPASGSFYAFDTCGANNRVRQRERTVAFLPELISTL